MTAIRPAWLLVLTAAVLLAGPVCAQSTDGGGTEATVHSTVIVDGHLQEDGKVPAGQSGLTVGAADLSPAERARRQAVDTYRSQVLTIDRDRQRPIASTTETVVQTQDVTVVQSGAGVAQSCVQIGVVGARADCQKAKK